MKNDFSMTTWIIALIVLAGVVGVSNYYWYRHILPWLIGCGHG